MTVDGTPLNFIQSIFQTPDGYLWLQTSRNVLRYDGYRFEDIPVFGREAKDFFILSAFQDDEGMVWIFTTKGPAVLSEGRFKFDIKNERTPDAASGPQQANANLSYLSIISDNRISPDDLPESLAIKDISLAVKDSRHNMWLGTFSKGIWSSAGKEVRRIDLSEGWNNQRIFSIIEDREGMIWVGTNDGLFEIVKPLSGTEQDIRHYSTASGLSGKEVRGLVQDDSGNIWIGTDSGLDRLTKGEGGRRIIHPELKNIHVLSCFVDREKGLWIGTRESGLKRLRAKVFTSFSLSEDSSSDQTRSVFVDSSGTIWAGSRYGKLYRFEEGFFREIAVKKDIFDNTLFTIAEDREGGLLLGTEHQGLHVLKNGRISPIVSDEGPVQGTIVTMFEDSRKRLWVGFYESELGYYQDGMYTRFLSQKEYPGKMVFNILEDSRGYLWLGSTSGLVFLENGRTDQASMKRYLEDDPISAIVEDQSGIIWLGTYNNGLIRFDPGTGHFARFAKKDGLGSDLISGMVLDSRNFFWMATTTGIMRVGQDDLMAFASGKSNRLSCVTFGLEDGLKSVECSIEPRNSAAMTKDGIILFATKKGIAAADPDHVPLNLVPPAVVVREFLVDGLRLDQVRENSPPVRINSRQNLEIRFAAITFSGTKNVQFSCRLAREGGPETPLNVGQDRAVSLGRLKPGGYSFFVSASNNHGVWNQDGARLQILVKPLFFETFLFRVAALLLFCLGLLAGLRLLSKRAAARNNKYQKTKLPGGLADRYCRELHFQLQEMKVYRDSVLSIRSLAEKMSIPPYHLSQVINERFQKNFYELVNGYRVEEAKLRLGENDGEQQKILTIALEVGFNTLGSFNRAFKRHTGITPSAYRKKNFDSRSS